MEPDDLLCSRNARPSKALVERAHSRVDQATLEEISRGGQGSDARRARRGWLVWSVWREERGGDWFVLLAGPANPQRNQTDHTNKTDEP